MISYLEWLKKSSTSVHGVPVTIAKMGRERAVVRPLTSHLLFSDPLHKYPMDHETKGFVVPLEKIDGLHSRMNPSTGLRQEDVNVNSQDMVPPQNNNPNPRITSSDTRFNLNKVSMRDEEEKFRDAYPNLNKEISKLSPLAQRDLHTLITGIMGQSAGRNRTTANRFRN